MTDTVPSFQAALQQIWKKNLPQTRERLALLTRAADELRLTGMISPSLHTEAHSIAHKLAGSLGMFGYPEATGYAREIEQALQPEGTTDAKAMAAQIEALYASLGTALED